MMNAGEITTLLRRCGKTEAAFNALVHQCAMEIMDEASKLRPIRTFTPHATRVNEARQAHAAWRPR